MPELRRTPPLSKKLFLPLELTTLLTSIFMLSFPLVYTASANNKKSAKEITSSTLLDLNKKLGLLATHTKYDFTAKGDHIAIIARNKNKSCPTSLFFINKSLQVHKTIPCTQRFAYSSFTMNNNAIFHTTLSIDREHRQLKRTHSLYSIDGKKLWTSTQGMKHLHRTIHLQSSGLTIGYVGWTTRCFLFFDKNGRLLKNKNLCPKHDVDLFQTNTTQRFLVFNSKYLGYIPGKINYITWTPILDMNTTNTFSTTLYIVKLSVGHNLAVFIGLNKKKESTLFTLHLTKDKRQKANHIRVPCSYRNIQTVRISKNDTFVYLKCTSTQYLLDSKTLKVLRQWSTPTSKNNPRAILTERHSKPLSYIHTPYSNMKTIHLYNGIHKAQFFEPSYFNNCIVRQHTSNTSTLIKHCAPILKKFLQELQ